MPDLPATTTPEQHLRAFLAAIPDVQMFRSDAALHPEYSAYAINRLHLELALDELGRNRAAVQRVREQHSNEDGVCGHCKGPDSERTSGDYEYWPCATYRATLPDPDGPAPEFAKVGGKWHWNCGGGHGCQGWTGIDLCSEDAARREYARHFKEVHLGVAPSDQPQPRREPRTWLESLEPMTVADYQRLRRLAGKEEQR